MVVQPSREALIRARDVGRGLSLATARARNTTASSPAASSLTCDWASTAEPATSAQPGRPAQLSENSPRASTRWSARAETTSANRSKQRITQAFANLNPDETGTRAGVEVLFVGLEDARPPGDAAKAYEQVLEASEGGHGRHPGRAVRAETLAKVVGSVEGAEEIVAAIAELDAMPVD